MNFADLTTSDIERLLLENATKRYEKLSQPDESMKWLNLAQAMGSPTKTGTFGESLGNVAGALGQYHTGEQKRNDSANDAMEQALSLMYKQKMDLEERKQKLKDSMKRKFFQTSEGTFGFADEDNQTVDVRAVGPSQMKIVEKIQDRYIKILSDQGQYNDADKLREDAYKLAMRDYSNMVNDTNFVPAKIGIDQNRQPNSSIDQIQIRPLVPISGADLTKESALRTALDVAPGGIPSTDNVYGKPIGKDPLGDPRYTDDIPGVNQPPLKEPIPIPSAGKATVAAKQEPIKFKGKQQIEQENKAHAEVLQQETKYIADQRKALDTYRPTVDSINRMEELTLSNTSQGPLSDVISTTGGIVNYFDPSSELAELAGNDAAYFSKLQNLVRDKIQALGAGTAISNLDMLVTQNSVGGLSKTKQGRLMILAALRADTEQSMMLQKAKIKYFEDNNYSLKGAPFQDSPLVGVVKRPQIMPDGQTLYVYQPITRDRWMSVAKSKNPKVSDQTLESEWRKFHKSFGGK